MKTARKVASPKKPSARKVAAPRMPKAKKVSPDAFSVTLTIGEKQFSASADACRDAIEALVVTVPLEVQQNPVLHAVLTITRKGKTYEHMLRLFQLRLFFTNPLNRQVLADLASSLGA